VFDSVRRLLGASDAWPSVPLRERDCHTHVIPGVDDGSRTLDESLDMLRLLRDAGARRVISTSHIFPGRFPNEPDALKQGFDTLVSAARDAGISVALELGAEHWLDESLLARAKDGSVLAFGRERYVLFETSTGPAVPALLFDVVHTLRDRGYTPLVAHVERYPWLWDEAGEEVLADLRSEGARFQVNRTLGRGGGRPRGGRVAFLSRLLTLGWIDEVGSDLHRATQDGRPYPMPGTA
jgi:tyrosine-protein phosphatase YwqE